MSPGKKISKKTAQDAPVPFEDVMNQLEGLVQSLEQGELGLEDSLKAFEDGVALARRAQKALDAMEKRIAVLSADGQLETMDNGDDDAASEP